MPIGMARGTKAMNRIEMTFSFEVDVKKKANTYVSRCKVMDVFSQGDTEQEAIDNLADALQLFLVSCIERGTLGAVLQECNVQPIKTKRFVPLSKHKRGHIINIPIPMRASGSCHPVECQA